MKKTFTSAFYSVESSCKHQYWRCWLFLVCLFLANFFNISNALAMDTVHLRPNIDAYSLGQEIEILEDPGGSLSFDQIRNRPEEFYPSTTDTPNFAFSSSAFWIHFRLHNPMILERLFLLEIGHPNIDFIQVYLPRMDHSWQKIDSGRRLPFADREIKHRNFIFNLHIPPGVTRDYYLRVKSSSAYYLPLHLLSDQAFARKDHEAQLGFGFYYGLIFVMIFYNLVLWLSVRDRNYLYYVLTLFFLHLLFQATNNGLAYEYFWPKAVWWNNHCLGFFLALSVFWTITFCQNFLQLKINVPRLNWLLNIFRGVALGLSVFNLTPDETFTSWLSIYWGSKIAISATLLIWTSGFLAWRRGYQAARYFLIAWSSLVLGALITGFTAFGLLPTSFWTTYALQIGTGIEVVLLSMALGDRLRVDQLKILEAQSARLQQEQLAKQSQERMVERLKKLDRLKDEFLANISHELRTPLNGIIGISESMLDGATGEMSREQKYNLSLVISSGRRLFHLVNDLIDFSQLKHKEIQLNLKPVWMREIVEVVLKLSKPLVGQKDLVLVNNIPEDAPPVMADEDRIQQILHNLVSNAIKFTTSGKVEISAHTTRKNLEITVSDTGPGIHEAWHERIFESFEQADGSATREHGGSGLGLAISRQLVELHGGRIRVDSAPGKGAHFHFLLPLAEEIQPQELKAPRIRLFPSTGELEEVKELVRQTRPLTELPTDHDAPFRILIVDDEPINLQVLVNMLALQRYSVTKANSGKEALDAIQNQTFDLILLDVMMPKMSGYEVCEAVRKQYPANSLPIVFLTAKNQVADLVQGFETGANDYLTKPVAKNELLARIKTHIHLSKINLSYARFVPDEFLKYLGHESILDVRLGDQSQQEMTVMFSDIRSFTSLSEQLSPKANFDFLNEYLNRISPIIRVRQGFIDKYIGDGIMALFPDDPQQAVDAAVDMLHEVSVFNLERQNQNQPSIQIGIGLHTGLLMLGTIGEEQRMEGTVISDAVNTAARLEGLTKLYGSQLIISDQTRQMLSQPEKYSMRHLGWVRVKGKVQSISIFEIFEAGIVDDFMPRFKSLAQFEKAVADYFEREIELAQTGFLATLEVNPKDTAARYYLERCERFLSQGIPDDVSPVFV
jgi:signal transduction histidine kinase/class 3 adenylate cyclase/CheY-like chemotaxis protein